MQVSNCMITSVYTVTEDAVLSEAMSKLADHMIETLPVINTERFLVGIVLLDDVLTLFMPNFVEMLRSADFIHDYSFLKKSHENPHLPQKSIREVMRKPFSVHQSSGLMEAMVLMHKHHVGELPVLDEEDRLIGIVSRGRAGGLFLSDWLKHLPLPGGE